MGINFDRKEEKPNDQEQRTEVKSDDSSALHSTTKFGEKELEEIQKISQRLDSDEKVEIVARQSRARPGGSVTTPDTIFVTNKRIIIRNPTLFGARENFRSITYDKMTSVDLEKGVFSSAILIMAPGAAEKVESIPKNLAETIVEFAKKEMENIKSSFFVRKTTTETNISIADELAKIAKLKEQGVLTEEEFLKMKQDLLRRI